LDALRREKTHQRAMAMAGQTEEATQQLVDQWLEDDQLPDSLLRMMFVCCSPLLDRNSQIALTLKILGGFSVSEIARGLLVKEESVRKRIQRAKKKLSQYELSLELPGPAEVSSSLSAVHDVLYLMFNEGYSTSHGFDPIRDDLCEEAARLCHILCKHGIGSGTTRALLALMLFHASRLESRVDADGAVVLLADQDRSKWDQGLIAFGHKWLFRSGEATSRFHLEACIASLHCDAPTVEATPWPKIVYLYQCLNQRHPSPVYRLNKAIATAEAGDIAAAMAELSQLQREKVLQDYSLLACAEARCHELLGDTHAAIACYLTALTQQLADHERQLLQKKVQLLQES
ncbi:RNA polymerase subunit sigma-70, partial [bacterium]|nr:RNA polymerase subunit sigma-70 [bacterium]